MPSVQQQCATGLQGLGDACGDAAANHVVPNVAQCGDGVCQQAVVNWWPKCKALSMFSTIDNNNNHQMTNFYDACEELSKPNCGACSGHASAQDTLPGDKRVLTAGSPQRAAFCLLFVGELANLLCVPSGQVHLNAITAAGPRGAKHGRGGGCGREEKGRPGRGSGL